MMIIKIGHATNDMHLDLLMICCHCYSFNYSEDFCLFKAVCDIKIIVAVVSFKFNHGLKLHTFAHFFMTCQNLSCKMFVEVDVNYRTCQ